MARNKHPEETVQRILTTASKLFLEKGYEKTSLQDIIRETGTVTGSAHQLNHFFCRQRRASLPQTCHHTAHDR